MTPVIYLLHCWNSKCQMSPVKKKKSLETVCRPLTQLHQCIDEAHEGDHEVEHKHSLQLQLHPRCHGSLTRRKDDNVRRGNHYPSQSVTEDVCWIVSLGICISRLWVLKQKWARMMFLSSNLRGIAFAFNFNLTFSEASVVLADAVVSRSAVMIRLDDKLVLT